MATWVEDIAKALELLGGVVHLSEIYAKVKEIRPVPFPARTHAIIRRAIESNSSDSSGFSGKDIFFSYDGIGFGVWGLCSKILNIENIPRPSDVDESDNNQSPARIMQNIFRIQRDTKLARYIKLLHGNRCQICDKVILLANGEGYSEAHHIMPLGRPHNVPDFAGNIIVLCPNDHVLLDYGVIELKLSDIRNLPNHIIRDKYIDYHNMNIYKNI